MNMVDEEMALLLAMMTHAGKGNLELVRLLDRETVPTMDISYECQRFCVLFERQGCLGVATLRSCFACWRKRS